MKADWLVGIFGVCWLSALGGFSQVLAVDVPPGPPGSEAARMRTLNQVEPRLPILAIPFTITNSGAYYLAGNLISTGMSGIIIQQDNVELDLRGFCLNGGNRPGTGVWVDGSYQNINIRNGLVKDWAGLGINADNAVLCSINDVAAINNSAGGIYVGPNSQVQNCRANGSYMGRGIDTGSGCVVSKCQSRGNQIGIAIGAQGRALECLADSNASDGMIAADYSVISRCQGSRNMRHGIQVASKCRVEDCAFSDNGGGFDGGSGIFVMGSQNRIENNSLAGNQAGISVETATASHNLYLRNSSSALQTNYIFSSTDAHGQIIDVSSNQVIDSSNPWSNFAF